jgi:hypothetical protein
MLVLTTLTIIAPLLVATTSYWDYNCLLCKYQLLQNFFVRKNPFCKKVLREIIVLMKTGLVNTNGN